ncbi:hypothetical protein TNCV_3440121 [Trichonephila clavipes]|uniref:Uncharacterized protein n=1 Tax=Trichonephila clavipes TaxID=2585209 RepID=A0A8X6W5V3_TRICX|nr:hypothetical protein TNCV_3440121 [Trichonephila clavipes]
MLEKVSVLLESLSLVSSEEFVVVDYLYSSNYGRQRHFGVCSKLKNINDAVQMTKRRIIQLLFPSHPKSAEASSRSRPTNQLMGKIMKEKGEISLKGLVVYFHDDYYIIHDANDFVFAPCKIQHRGLQYLCVDKCYHPKNEPNPKMSQVPPMKRLPRALNSHSYTSPRSKRPSERPAALCNDPTSCWLKTYHHLLKGSLT